MEDVIQTEHDSATDDSLRVASKCWERVMDAAAKTGYREGVHDGEDSVLQEGFDIGYKDGFETAFTLGRYKALAASMSTSEHPTDVAVALDKIRRGACWICETESRDATSNPRENTPFSEVLSEQRVHSAKAISRLHEYFEPILKKSGIEINSTP